MTDDDVERLLSRYRPAGPSPRLRERVLRVREAESPGSRIWWWTAAAAVIAATALRVATVSTYDAIRTTLLEPSLAARESLVTQLAADLGGGAWAREEADRLVSEAEAEVATVTMAVRQ